jgi:hypothetical protein
MLPLLLGTLLTAACPVSPVEDFLHEFVAPMTGESPAWLIDTSGGRWESSEARVKTLWVFSQKASGPLHVEGRRLDGEGTARFQDGGVEGTPKDGQRDAGSPAQLRVRAELRDLSKPRLLAVLHPPRHG